MHTLAQWILNMWDKQKQSNMIQNELLIQPLKFGLVKVSSEIRIIGQTIGGFYGPQRVAIIVEYRSREVQNFF